MPWVNTEMSHSGGAWSVKADESCPESLEERKNRIAISYA